TKLAMLPVGCVDQRAEPGLFRRREWTVAAPLKKSRPVVADERDQGESGFGLEIRSSTVDRNQTIDFVGNGRDRSLARKHNTNRIGEDLFSVEAGKNIAITFEQRLELLVGQFRLGFNIDQEEKFR